MNEDQQEEVLEALQSAGNFMMGMSLDPCVRGDIEKALKEKANECFEVVEKYV